MDPILAQLRRALGEAVELRVADPREPSPPLWPEERDAVARAVDKRRREHAWGRSLARDALAQLGAPAGPLPMGPDRRPRWPDGFIGSISHCDDLCAVLVARREAVRAVGLDLEPRAPLEAELWPIVLTAAERSTVEREAPGPAGERAKLFFVVKEAYYKAQFELTETLLDFGDVEVELDAQGSFRASCARTGLEPLEGRFSVEPDHLWAWVVVPALR